MWKKMGKVEQFSVICVVFALRHIFGNVKDSSKPKKTAPIVEAQAKVNPAVGEKKAAVESKSKQPMAQKFTGKWQKVMNTPVGGLYIDHLGTRYMREFIETTTMINFGADKGIKVGETPLVSVVNIHRWDCDNHRMQLYKMTGHGRSMAQGEQVHVFEPLGEFEPA